MGKTTKASDKPEASTVSYQVHLPEELHRRLKARAAMDGSTIAKTIVAAIESYLQKPAK
jgi:predicted DNA-binding protein